MANSKSAEKRIRQNVTRNLRNRGYRSGLRTEMKSLRTAVAEGEKSQADALLPGVLASLDSLAGKGVIHRNAAARTKSRLTRAVAALS